MPYVFNPFTGNLDFTETGGGGGGSPGGSSGEIQYNNAGAFGGAALATYATVGDILSVAGGVAGDMPLTVTGTVLSVSTPSGFVVASATTGMGGSYIGDGSTVSYRLYAYVEPAGQGRIYSASYAALSYVLPNDTLDYVLGLSWTAQPPEVGFALVTQSSLFPGSFVFWYDLGTNIASFDDFGDSYTDDPPVPTFAPTSYFGPSSSFAGDMDVIGVLSCDEVTATTITADQMSTGSITAGNVIVSGTVSGTWNGNTIPISKGGTGATTLTTDGPLYNNGIAVSRFNQIVYSQSASSPSERITAHSNGGATWWRASSVGTTDVWRIENGSGVVQTRMTSGLLLAMGGSHTPLARLHLATGSASTVGQIVQAAASQTANLQEWQNSSASVLASVGPDGAAKFTGFSIAITSKTANYTATVNDSVILCDATSAGFTITLPASATNTGRKYVIKKTDTSANTVTIDGNASETIDGATTVNIGTQYQSITIVCDGSNWWII
jgi:hypothetical protein